MGLEVVFGLGVLVGLGTAKAVGMVKLTVEQKIDHRVDERAKRFFGAKEE